jgi:hypothetical protein
MPSADCDRTRKVPNRLMRTVRSKLAMSWARISPVSFLRDTVFWPVAMPAQLTVRRSWPWAARALAKAAATSSSEVTSTLQKTPPISLAMASPFSSFMSNRATFAPVAAMARAVPSPRPEAPPVTTAAIELSSFMRKSLCCLNR